MNPSNCRRWECGSPVSTAARRCGTPPETRWIRPRPAPRPAPIGAEPAPCLATRERRSPRCPKATRPADTFKGKITRRDRPTRAAFLQETLFLFLLARDAMLGPRYRFQPLGQHLFLAVRAESIFAGLNPLQGLVDHRQHRAVGIRHSKEEFRPLDAGDDRSEEHTSELSHRCIS